MRKRSWTDEQLKVSVSASESIRQVLKKLGLREAGGNYAQIKKYIAECNLDITHFKGQAWNKGKTYPFVPKIPLKRILVRGSDYQSYKLKNRLFMVGLKKPFCEICGWAKESKDGRVPLELDHINGDSKDNRLSNLRILCPNCHSLQPTHRGKNRTKSLGARTV